MELRLCSLGVSLLIYFLTACSPQAYDRLDEPAFDVNTIEDYTILGLGGMEFDQTDFNDPVAREITRKTGVRLVFEYPVGSWNEKLALVIASEDYPDLIINKDTAMTQLVNAGVLQPLRERIENSPNLAEYYGTSINRLTYSLDDPEYYSFGTNSVVDEAIPGKHWNPAFAVQIAALDSAGYPQIKTLQDYEQVIADYVAANPVINGQPAIGISLVASDGWRWKISVTNPAGLATGKPDDGEWYIDPETYKAEFRYKNPDEKEYFRWLNHLNDIGLLDPESFIQTYDAYQTKIAEGRVVGLIDALWEYDLARSIAVAKVGEDRDYITFPVLTDPDRMVWSSERSAGYANAGGVMVTKACKNVDKIVNFFDYMVTEECIILRRWGIEGKDYDIIDGVRTEKPEIKARRTTDYLAYRKTEGVKRWCSAPFLTPGYGYRLSDGSLLDEYDESEILSSYSDSYRNVLQAYGIIGINEIFPQVSDFSESPWGNAWTLPIGKTVETKEIVNKAEDITFKAVLRAVLADPDDFDTEWDCFLAEIEEINIGVLEDEVTSLIAERMELWGTN